MAWSITNVALFAAAAVAIVAITMGGEEEEFFKMEYTTYPNHPEFPDVDLSTLMKFKAGTFHDLPKIHQFAPKKFARLLLRKLHADVSFGLLGRERAVLKAGSAKEAFDAIYTKDKLLGFIPNPFNILPRPAHVMDHWEEDKEFARQFLTGTNPVMITVAKDLGQISDNIVKHFGKAKLQGLVKSKRLFFVSYDDLVDLQANPHKAYPLPMNWGAPADDDMHFYAPIVVFELDEDRKELDVMGIQLERDRDSRVYTRETCGENEWLFIKSCVTTSDSQMHQWVSHLGNTHMTMEPLIMAVHNTLAEPNHHLYTLIKPFLQDTMHITSRARQTLASYDKNAFGDHQSSSGVGQLMQLVNKMWSRYDFFEKSSLPNELAKRGFDEDFDMPGYYFREDGLKIWTVLGTFVKDFVDEFYASDADVVADKLVQEWATESSSPDRAAVPGFPKSFKDKATLVLTLQTMMWVSSGLHGAVNTPQYDHYGYVPNKPLGGRAHINDMPENDADIRDWMFESFMPHVNSGDKFIRESTMSGWETSLDIVWTVWTLSLPSDHCLDNLNSEFKTVGRESYMKFLKNLKPLSDAVEKRNEEDKKDGKKPYNYLNPKKVPASIDI